MKEKFYYKSPIGILEIITDNDKLISLKLIIGNNETQPKTEFQKDIKTQLDEYFNGKRKIFDIQLKPNGTEFQKKVWNALSIIPFGETRSYKEIAEIIKNPNGVRAVGNACNKNPILIIIPCHRVISKNGDLRGFECGINIKKYLLDFERN